MRVRFVLCAAGFVACTLVARADGIGTLVTGTLQVENNGLNPTLNYFDPANGNTESLYGPTILIGSGEGLTYSAGIDTLTADFTGSTLTILFSVFYPGADFGTMTFTDPAFTGFTETREIDDAIYEPYGTCGPVFSPSYSGKTLTVGFGTGDYGCQGDYEADFTYTTASVATPEPSSVELLTEGLLGVGLVGTAGVFRRRFA